MAQRKMSQIAAAAHAAASPATHSAALAAPVVPEVKLSPVHDGKYKPPMRTHLKLASVANVAATPTIGIAQTDNKKAQEKATREAGMALADLTIDAARKEGQLWKPIMSSLFDRSGDTLYHKAYQKGLADARRNENEKHRYEAHDETLWTGKGNKASKATNDSKGLTRSNFTRLSELTTLSKACAAGFSKATMTAIWSQQMPGADGSFEKMPAASIFKAARLYLSSQADANAAAGVKTGRAAPGVKAKPILDKVKDYILKTVAHDAKALKAIETMVHTMVLEATRKAA